MTNREIEFYKDNILLDNEASFAPFGYSFQADAGLFLFCHYYKDVESIKIESSLQDIEMKSKTGTFIMAQAKASQDPFNCTTHSNKLFDALFSLAKHYVTNNDILIYVTNIPNLFGDEMNGQFNDTIYAYKQLSEAAKQIVKNKFNDIKKRITDSINKKDTSENQRKKLKIILDKIDSFNFNNLRFLSITRYTDDNQRQSIKNKISEFLQDVFGMNEPNKISLIINDLFSTWHDMFYLNSTKNGMKNDKTITKDSFCWPIITINNMRTSPDEICEYFDGEYDRELGYELIRRRDEFIKYYNYELINEIINDYTVFKSSNSLCKKKEFVVANWEKYSKYFREEDPIICKGVTMFYLYGVLSDYITAKKVLKGKSI